MKYRTVGVLESRMGGEDGIVGFNDRSGNLRGGVDSEFQFGFLGVLDSQTFEEESTESRSGTTTE